MLDVNELKEYLIKTIEKCDTEKFQKFCEEKDLWGDVQAYVTFITQEVREGGFEIVSVDKIKEENYPYSEQDYCFRTIFSIKVNQYYKNKIDLVILIGLDYTDSIFLNPKVLEISSSEEIEREFYNFLNSDSEEFVNLFKLIATKCCRDLMIEREFHMLEMEEQRRKEKMEENEDNWIPPF